MVLEAFNHELLHILLRKICKTSGTSPNHPADPQNWIKLQKKSKQKNPKNIISGMISFKRQVASRFRNMTPPVPPTSTHSFYSLQFFKEFSIAAMIKSSLNCLHI